MFFKHKYVIVQEITKADAIVVAVNLLAKVLQGKILAVLANTAQFNSHDL